MSAPSDGGDAYPYTGHGHGMSLRAYLCAHAPQIPHGWLENEWVAGKGIEPVRYREVPQPERHARWRLTYADAQIALLKGKTP